jgi:hypothetical protein
MTSRRPARRSITSSTFDSYESKRKQKLKTQQVMPIGSATPEYLKWSEVPITFDRSNHLDFIPKSG